jgi:hypothetical protein
MLDNYFKVCYRLIPDTSKPRTRQVTDWIPNVIHGVLDIDSSNKTLDSGKTGQVIEGVLLSDKPLYAGERLEYQGKIYKVIGDSNDPVSIGHHYETKVSLITGVTTS